MRHNFQGYLFKENFNSKTPKFLKLNNHYFLVKYFSKNIFNQSQNAANNWLVS
jgi:hypothetical protein